MKRISLLKTAKIELLSWKAIITIMLIGCLYILFTASLLNYQLAINTLLGEFPFTYKLSIFTNLFFGIWTTMNSFDVSIFLITALLVGVNMYLLGRTLYIIQKADKRVRLSIGGATLIGIVTTGCTSCGVSVLSVLGLSASLSFLPFHGIELHIGAIVLLIISAIYMLKQLWNTKYCKI